MAEAKKAGRRPADAGQPGRQEIWEAVRRQTGAFTVSGIVETCGASRRTVSGYLECLAAGEYVSCTPPESVGQPARYTLLKDTGYHAPRLRQDGSVVTQGQAAEQLWTSMRILKRFTSLELMETATIEIPEGTAKAYCRTLLAAGYLKVLRKAEPAKGRIALYQLIRQSGPKPPQVQRVKRVFDPNTGDVYPLGDRA
ncbi:MAG: hypothetical protein CML68_20435 [Rhodobacteraceae bacterium]|nr:hypothetical protein [Paracoccaceae bacterium]